MSSTKQLLEEEPSPAPLATTRRESGMGEHAMDTLGLGIQTYRDTNTSRHLRDV